ncbi:MAG: type II toxin-antitoxin system VapC family toxin [Burkholderiales bacterium]|nr:type II toxin-antitoxin system VapC family toxin [Burkholderiales bacterium]
MFLLDTNTLIYFFKGEGGVAARLLATPPDQVAVCTVSLFELETGLRKSSSPKQRRKQLDAFVSAAQVWDLDRAAAAAAADIRAALEAKGQPIGPLDNLIAGIALAHDAMLVTRNLREFSRVAKLKTVDWHG